MSERVERRATPDRRVADRRRAALPQLVADRRSARAHRGRRRADRQVRSAHRQRPSQSSVPFLLTVDEVADALRTTRKAVYAMIERGYLPGLVRVRRRILVRQASLLQWLQEKGAPSLRETER
jgi:excisionase family DNA binding protein